MLQVCGWLGLLAMIYPLLNRAPIASHFKFIITRFKIHTKSVDIDRLRHLLKRKLVDKMTLSLSCIASFHGVSRLSLWFGRAGLDEKE